MEKSTMTTQSRSPRNSSVMSKSNSLLKPLRTEDECLLTFSMLDRRGKVIQKGNFPTLCHITVTEDSVKFQEMFDQARHLVLIIHSKFMMSSVQNAIYEMMKNIWTPGYTRPCYSQLESSNTALDKVVASAAATIGSQPMAPSTARQAQDPL